MSICLARFRQTVTPAVRSLL